MEHTLLQSHLLWGEFSICALCCSYSQSLQFSFLVPPGTHHCWVDRGGVIWEACPTPLHMAGSVTRAAVTHPSTNQARRCLCLGPIGDFCIGDGEMYSYTRDVSRCLAILSINTSRLFMEGSVIPPEHRLMLVNFHRECISDAKKRPVGPRHFSYLTRTGWLCATTCNAMNAIAQECNSTSERQNSCLPAMRPFLFQSSWMREMYGEHIGQNNKFKPANATEDFNTGYWSIFSISM